MKMIRVNQHSGMVPIKRIFDCRTCGFKVCVNEKNDKRVVYCSSACEKKYWRDKTRRSEARRKRGQDTSSFRNYSQREMIIKLWREKQESS